MYKKTTEIEILKKGKHGTFRRKICIKERRRGLEALEKEIKGKVRNFLVENTYKRQEMRQDPWRKRPEKRGPSPVRFECRECRVPAPAPAPAAGVALSLLSIAGPSVPVARWPPRIFID